MVSKVVWLATLTIFGAAVATSGALAQYRGYDYEPAPGYGQAPLGYSQAPPGYDQAPRGYDPFDDVDNRRESYRSARPEDPGASYGQDQEPPYVDPQDAGRARQAPSDQDLGESANRRTVTEVADPTHQPAGTIVIDTASRHLYLVERDGQALQYGIGVGREGFAWKGDARIQRKAEWPDWIPPGDMLKRRPDLPLRMAGGIENPLGARALYLFQGNRDTLFRIHGTNEPDTIGKAVSSGCIRMMNADVIDLYQRVPVGTRVKVL